MGTTPPSDKPSFAEENAMRIASESLSYYDEPSDTYHCAYGPPAPGINIRDLEREILVRVDPQTGQVMGFTIPDFKEWHSRHAEDDGGFEVDLPPVWPLGPMDDAGTVDDNDG